MYCVHHCWYSGETGLHQKAISTGTFSVYQYDRLYRTVILYIVLYGFETWFFTLRERLKLRMFQSRIMRKIFGPKMMEETGDWRKLHYEDRKICAPHQMLFG
jgi:hypothetical protein